MAPLGLDRGALDLALDPLGVELKIERMAKRDDRAQHGQRLGEVGQLRRRPAGRLVVAPQLVGQSGVRMGRDQGVADGGQLGDYLGLAGELGLAALVEVHAVDELDRALGVGARLVGVNNRDLKTFTTSLAVTERLAPLAPEGTLLVGESGINSHADCQRLAASGVRCFLVGESLMRQDDVVAATNALLNG